MATAPEPADDRAAGPVGAVTAGGPAPSGRPRSRGPGGRLDAGRCSVRALSRGDEPVATAPPAARWLLVEQPGPWGYDALHQSRFDREVAAQVAHRARVENLRVLMIRRPGNGPAAPGRWWAVADARPGAERVSWARRGSDAELLDVPWDGSAGTPADGPVFLVCAHGAHDVCCAVRGRVLARSLPGGEADRVWECSHVGGCRFAANLLVLPHGFYYGQLPGDGAEVVAAHARGEVALPWLRGRAGLAIPAQAAQHLARGELGLLGTGDLPLRSVHELARGGGVERWRVVFGAPGGDVVVTVESRPAADAGPLTCRAAHPMHPRTWQLVSLAPVDAAAS